MSSSLQQQLLECLLPCYKMSKKENVALMEMPTYGRPFQLGMLYDAISDKLIQGKELWGQAAIQRAQQDKPYLDTQFKVILDSSLTTKSLYLGANSADLRMNLLARTAHISGAAKFFADQKATREIVQVSVQFQCSSHTQELDLRKLGKIKNRSAISATRATHVVVKILYGLEAFVVLSRPKSAEESQVSIQEKMTGCADFLANIYDSGKSDLTDIDREEAKKYSFRIYSDAFLPTASPTTFEELVSTIEQHLLKHFKQGSGSLVPKKVWLYPLKELDSSAPSITQEVSTDVVSLTERITENLLEAKVWVSDLGSVPVCSMFPCFQEQHDRLAELIEWFHKDWTQQLSSAVPNVRAGTTENDLIVSHLKQVEASPVGPQNLTTILQELEEEIRIVSQFIQLLTTESVKCVSSSEIDTLALEHECIVSFEFRVGGVHLTSLSEIEECIRNRAISKRLQAASSKLKIIPWYKQGSTRRAMQISGKLFKEFAQVNAKRSDTAFVIHVHSDISPHTKEGAAVILYGDGEPTEYELPSKPLKPHIIQDVGKKIHLAWSKPKYGQTNVTSYLVSYCSTADKVKGEVAVRTEGPVESIILQDLVPNCEYEFCVQAECVAGLSPKSELLAAKNRLHRGLQGKVSQTSLASIATPLITSADSCFAESSCGSSNDADSLFSDGSPDISGQENPNSFKSPQMETKTHKSVDLIWEAPDVGIDTVDYYNMLYHVDGDSAATWKKRTMGSECHITVDGLICETRYVFTIQAILSSGQTLKSESTRPIETDSYLAETIRRKSKKIHERTAKQPAMYELTKTCKLKNDQKRMAKYEVGELSGNVGIRVLMVVGATGAGKTTLINGIANYMYGVQWEDDFRFVLVANEPTQKSQAHSQTSWITAYTLHRGEGSPIPYSLTIIDTPGFGDTEGIERDKKIATQIKDFFSLRPPEGIDVLHGIGFVAQASLARLSPSQKYIFDSILSIYGRDVASNIFVMTTFADGQDPPVMEAIAEAKIPHQTYFKFNNSALFTLGKEGLFDAIFWQMGMTSFDDFFLDFGRATHRSLQLTREVLDEREQLENVLKELQPQIHVGLTKMDELSAVVNLLEHNKNLVEQNKDFTITVPVTKQRKLDTPPGRYTTNCLSCNFTCHDNCAYANNEDKIKCCAMNGNGDCTACPGQCVWSKHVNNPYIFELYQESEIRTAQELKDRYDTAKEGESRAETMIANIKDELKALENIVLQLVDRARRSLIRLDEIALKPNPLSEVDYIDQLIKSEEQQCKLGWQERVAAYQTLRKKAVLMRKIKNPLSEVDYIDQLIKSEEQQCKLGWQERVAAYQTLRKKAVLMRKIKKTSGHDSTSTEDESLFDYLREDSSQGLFDPLAESEDEEDTPVDKKKKPWYRRWPWSSSK